MGTFSQTQVYEMPSKKTEQPLQIIVNNKINDTDNLLCSKTINVPLHVFITRYAETVHDLWTAASHDVMHDLTH